MSLLSFVGLLSKQKVYFQQNIFEMFTENVQLENLFSEKIVLVNNEDGLRMLEG